MFNENQNKNQRERELSFCDVDFEILGEGFAVVEV